MDFITVENAKQHISKGGICLGNGKFVEVCVKFFDKFTTILESLNINITKNNDKIMSLLGQIQHNLDVILNELLDIDEKTQKS